MSGAIPPLPQYAFMAWCLVKAQRQLYLLPLEPQNAQYYVQNQFKRGNVFFHN
jgi:hypothetical protein